MFSIIIFFIEQEQKCAEFLKYNKIEELHGNKILPVMSRKSKLLCITSVMD